MTTQFLILYVRLIRRTNGFIKRSVFLKPTWNGQCTHFYNFMPLNRKRSLFRGLSVRANTISSEDTNNDEIKSIRLILIENCYPKKFVIRHSLTRNAKPATQTAYRKQVFIRLPFKGNGFADIGRRQLFQDVNSTYNAAQIQLLFTEIPMVQQQLKDRLPRLT